MAPRTGPWHPTGDKAAGACRPVLGGGGPVTETAAAEGQLSHTYECGRDYHLFGPGPKRILALDGGGVRGAISVAFLERIEAVFSERQRQVVSAELKAREIAGAGTQELAEIRGNLEADKKVRLADRFDLVGGTSTGAIIAGALALGFSTAQVKDFYLKLAPRIFRRPFWRVPGLQSKFDAGALREEIANIVSDRTLASDDLVTGLCIVTKRIDTGSPWIVSNDPLAPYWNKQQGQTYLANKDYKLSTLVRASTAAPHYFDPEIIPVTEEAQASSQDQTASGLASNPWLSMMVSRLRALYGLFSSRGPNPQTHGLFIDGGVTPFNNPSMALMMLAVLKPYQICWPLGPDQLTFVSVGTGSSRTRLSFKELGFAGPLRLAIGALLSLMSDAEAMALAQMQWLGDCPDPWEINSEIKTLAEALPAGHRWFRFMRYDVKLEAPWLKTHLDLNLSDAEVARYRNMDDPGIVTAIYDIARAAAEKQVKATHFFPDRSGAVAAT